MKKCLGKKQTRKNRPSKDYTKKKNKHIKQTKSTNLLVELTDGKSGTERDEFDRLSEANLTQTSVHILYSLKAGCFFLLYFVAPFGTAEICFFSFS